MVYKGDRVEFKTGKKIGNGGNGDVFYAFSDSFGKQEVVSKFLRVNDSKNFDEKYQRFINEIRVVNELNNKIDGLLPIIDSYTPEKLNKGEREQPWYLMPYAQSFWSVASGKSVYEKICYLRELAVILRGIHNNGYVHRDVKPENIFIYDGKIKLGDFGLVWHEAIDGLTRCNERVGAWATMAPEMKRYAYRLIDPYPADVYSFAKTLWIVLTEDRESFEGQYAKNKVFALDHKILEVDTMEDIHYLLENATDDDRGKRPSMDDCIKLIDAWVEANNDKRIAYTQNIDAMNKEIQIKYEGDITVFKQKEKIIRIVSDIIKNLYIQSMQINEFYPDKCVVSDINDCIEISDERARYVMKPVELIKQELENNTRSRSRNPQYEYTLKLESIKEEEIPIKQKDKYVNINDINPLGLFLGGNQMQKVLLNEEAGIKFVERI